MGAAGCGAGSFAAATVGAGADAGVVLSATSGGVAMGVEMLVVSPSSTTSSSTAGSKRSVRGEKSTPRLLMWQLVSAERPSVARNRG